MKYLVHICFIFLLVMISMLPSPVYAQRVEPVADSTAGYSSLPGRVFNSITKKQTAIANSIDKQTKMLLSRMMKKEDKLRSKLHAIDSTKAQTLFASSNEKYQELAKKLHTPIDGNPTAQLNNYLPGLDSVKTSLQFLSKLNTSLPMDKLAKINETTGKLKELQGKMQVATEVQQYIRERESYLKQQLQNTPLAKYVKGLNKEVYYYQQRIAEYKALINDPDKMAKRVLGAVRQLPAFQRFFAKNSYLSQLFQMPGAAVSPNAIAGLQTRAGVQNILSQRLNSGAVTNINPDQYMQQQVQGAQSQIDQLKDKINRLGGGNSDITMPDFKPNNQRTKSFLKRIEFGFSIQSQKSTNQLPATSTLALTAGYKLGDGKTIGFGASYNLGLGRGFNHIKLTNEGVGVRSFIDIKIKNSFWATGGFEYTYYQSFAKFSDLPNVDVWQKSALFGITKKYSIGKKKQGNVQLLYDFLANKQTPHGEPLKFRLGYSL